MIGFVISFVFVLIGPVPPASSPATTQESDELQRIQKKLLEMVPRFKSLSANLVMKIDFSSAGSWDRSDAQGTVEYLIQSDKVLSRVDLTSESISAVGAAEMKSVDIHTLYGDGKYVFDVGESNGSPMAFKLNSDPMQIAVPSSAMFDVWRTRFETKALPEEKLDGEPVWVIEMRPKDKEKSIAVRTVSYFRKDIPLMVKTISYDKFDRPFQWTTLSNIKVNPKLDPERIVFKPPPDFEFYDATEDK